MLATATILYLKNRIFWMFTSQLEYFCLVRRSYIKHSALMDVVHVQKNNKSKISQGMWHCERKQLQNRKQWKCIHKNNQYYSNGYRLSDWISFIQLYAIITVSNDHWGVAHGTKICSMIWRIDWAHNSSACKLTINNIKEIRGKESFVNDIKRKWNK